MQRQVFLATAVGYAKLTAKLTRPVDFVHGLEIIALGMALFMILELEKLALRKWRKKHDGCRGSPGQSEAES